ncbi:GFA family protein [Saccharospirillum sp. MSK14-1]|uniref:GFA family protein n=1 Tax=Saccharospirillum sp. MSK14-1 TaxID=1897632 RepID=UPI000D34134B|nr:GFA family protein [Saccharospirillum sp. MSK14-1]
MDGTCHCAAVHWHSSKKFSTATACNCTLCRRYGVLWGYDYEGEAITVTGPARTYVHGDAGIGFHFCPHCGCIAYWRSIEAQPDGRRRIAVNLRLAEPEAVADIPIKHFDGLDRFEPLPQDGRCVRDYWG